MSERTSQSVYAAKLNPKSKSNWFEIKRHHLRMALIMLCADLLGFGAAGAILFVTNLWAHVFIFQWSDLKYLVIVFFSLALYIQTKLYPAIGLNPAEEIRLVSINTLIGFLLGIFIFSFDQKHWSLNYLVFIPFCFISIIFVLTMRWGLRILCVKLGLWGAPVVVIGRNKDIKQLAQYFLNRRRLGLVPQYVVTDNNDLPDITMPVPLLDMRELFACSSNKFSSGNIYTALIDISSGSEMLDASTLLQLSRLFSRLVFVSNMDLLEGAALRVHDFEGLVGVEVRRNTINPLDMVVKRVVDIVLTILLGMLLSPLLIIVAVLIKLDSRGPIFYSQLRVGKDEKNIHMLKFRSMAVNAEQILEDYLNSNAIAKREWEQVHKLRHDPRLTRVGKWIRKFSIDELPQLINVLKGEMSLVGPRPLPLYHHELLSSEAKYLRASVNSGVTGLWQVSGRSNLGTHEMELLDSYYVHNWSPWLDVYILLRTVWVVLTKDGAY